MRSAVPRACSEMFGKTVALKTWRTVKTRSGNVEKQADRTPASLECVSQETCQKPHFPCNFANT